MFACVEIIGLKVFGYHGLFDEERRLGQQFSVDIEAHLASGGSHRSDDLKGSVRYDELINAAVGIVSSSSYATVEALAEAVAIAVLHTFEPIEAVTVGVAKLHPPISQTVGRVGVRIKVARSEIEKLSAPS